MDDNLSITQFPELTTTNIVVVAAQTETWKILLVSYYFEPDQPIEPYIEHMRRAVENTEITRIVVGGDANAKNIWWGSPTIDVRGENFHGFLEESRLHVLNVGNIPTFDTIRGNKRYTSFVDVTACSINILDLVDDWKVEEGMTSSDHNGISFNIRLHKSKGTKITRSTRTYNTKKANWPQFHAKLRQFIQEQNFTESEIDKIDNKVNLEQAIKQYNTAITQACKHAIPKKKSVNVLTMPWWSEELAKLKREVATRKRRIRCAAQSRRQKVVVEYLEHKERYELEAKNAQTASWREFCEKQDKEGVWEGIYRIIGRTLRREEDVHLEKDGRTLDAKGSAELLADTFYPEDTTEGENEGHHNIRVKATRVNLGEHEEPCDPPFTLTELEVAKKSFNPKKAPGGDGFTADICEQAINENPNLFLSLLNKCLQLHLFPQAWKKATVVILRKPGKENYKVPKSYRPIGLLPILGKVFEKMLVARMKYYLLPGMSPRQYGFMPQKSTEDSLYNLMKYIHTNLKRKKIITLVSLDIEGAFDSAWWPAIRVRLAEEKCPVNIRRVLDSYLNERTVIVRYCGEEACKTTSKGCVQGSIAGPLLWNLLLDPLLKSLENVGEFCQAFADDVILAFSGDTALDIERRANTTLEHVLAWGVKNKLKFAPTKTNAMVITKKLKYDTPRLSMGGVDVGLTDRIKLLGLTIDHKLTFDHHVANVCKRATGIYRQLATAAKASWGLHPEVIRSIYTAAVEPVILYAASAWAPAVSKIGTSKYINAVQRGFAQKLCKSYRTVSLNSALVLAGILPLDLRVREAASLYEARRGEPLPALGDREVEQMTPAIDSPHPAEHIRHEFIALVDQDTLDANSDFEVRIFTDGSKIDGRVGAAFSLWKGETEVKAVKLSLPSFCTVYQAELLAMCRASKEIQKRSESTFAIYSDSTAALQSITALDCLHPLAVETRRNCKVILHQNKTVKLFWVKAHIGLAGNERADYLAKEAALHSKKKPDYDLCPLSFVKRSIRMQTLDEWEQRYRSGTTAGVTKLFFPSAVAAYRLIRKIDMTYLTTQVMTGHGGFSEYLNRFKCKESPSCNCDPDAMETVPHILIECPTFELPRFTIEQEIDTKMVEGNIHSIVASKHRHKFLEYCIKICKIVINRNKT